MSQALKSLTKPQLITAYNAVVAELETLRTINAAHQTLVISARERIAAADHAYREQGYAEAHRAERAAAERELHDGRDYDLVQFSRYTVQQRADWKAKQIAKLPKPAYVKPTYVAPQWQVERAAAMAAAKAQAMASGTHCKVQS
jgi:hypothetical protein